MRISDWSSDVCSSDLSPDAAALPLNLPVLLDPTGRRAICHGSLQSSAYHTVTGLRKQAVIRLRSPMLGPHGWEPSTPYSRGSAGGSMPRARKSFRIQSAPIQAVAEEGTCRQSQSMVPGFARTFQVQGGRKLDSPGGSAEKRPTRSSFVLGKNAR